MQDLKKQLALKTQGFIKYRRETNANIAILTQSVQGFRRRMRGYAKRNRGGFVVRDFFFWFLFSIFFFAYYYTILLCLCLILKYVLFIISVAFLYANDNDICVFCVAYCYC